MTTANPYQTDALKHHVESRRSMWAAVISQALEDATLILSEASHAANRKAKQDARAWFTRGGKDFREVCSLAGLDHEAVRTAALKKIEASDGEVKPKHKSGPYGRRIDYKGERLTVAEISERTGVSAATINHRLKAGVPADQISIRKRVPVLLLTYSGETHSLKEWAAIRGMSSETLASRLKMGWSVERALTTAVIPAGERFGRGRKRSVDTSKAA